MNHEPHTTPADDSCAERSMAAAFEALRTQRRRQILARLADREAVEIRTLADEVAARAPAYAECRHATEITLRHTNLPKLADMGFIEVDSDRDVVRLRPSPLISSLLAVAAETDATA